MSKLDTIKDAISNLPEDRVWSLSEWLDELKAQLWDAQMERDAAAWKLDKTLRRPERIIERADTGNLESTKCGT